MNRFDNLRARGTREKIKNALFYLLKHKSFNEIYVKDICTVACINRSSFYQHYQDINDLMLQTEEDLSNSMAEIFKNAPYYDHESFVKMFKFIKDNVDFYRAFLTNHEGSFMDVNDFKFFKKKMESNLDIKSEIPQNELTYHMAFFSAGLNAVCKAWINNGLIETPEQMAEIIKKEYRKNQKFFM